MDDKELQKLQRYIGKRSLGQTDEAVIMHIEKIEKKYTLSQEEWEKLLYPVCANVDTALMQYILQKLETIENVKEYILHTVRFRQNRIEYQLKQVEILNMLWNYVKDENSIDILNDTLVNAAWFGELEVVKFLVQKGADIKYICSNGKSIIELSQNSIDKFNDYRVYEYISDLL